MAALITVEEYKQFIGYEGNKEDSRMQSTIDAVSSAITEYLGYSLDLDKDYVLLTTAGRVDYFVDAVDIEVTGLKYISPLGEETVFSNGQYFTNEYGKITILAPTPIHTNGRLVVTYTQSGTSSREDIKLAAKLLTRFYYKDEYNVQTVNTAGASVTYITGKNFPPHVRTLLDLHRVL